MTYIFEKKQYEMAANIELSRQSPHIYSPGQVLEHLLGFDVATAQPSQSPIWSILGMGLPGGIQLQPHLWTNNNPPPAASLPTYAISLILQYKRSEYQNSPRNKHYSHWKAPHYRFFLDRIQHAVLMALETGTTPHALIRYAAPVFHYYSDLEKHQLNQQILTNSSYFSPVSIGAAHTICSFSQPGVNGWANPEGGKIVAQSWDAEEFLERNRTQTTLAQHLKNLALGVFRANLSQHIPMPKELRISEKQIIQDIDTIEAVFNLCHVARAVSLAGASWYLNIQSE